MADFRAFSAVRNKCLHEGWCSLADYRVFNASRFLLKLAEHTWGLYGIGESFLCVTWRNLGSHTDAPRARASRRWQTALLGQRRV